jgi:hypothetical protein
LTRSAGEMFLGSGQLDVGIQKIQTILLNESYNAIALQSVASKKTISNSKT